MPTTISPAPKTSASGATPSMVNATASDASITSIVTYPSTSSNRTKRFDTDCQECKQGEEDHPDRDRPCDWCGNTWCCSTRDTARWRRAPLRLLTRIQPHPGLKMNYCGAIYGVANVYQIHMFACRLSIVQTMTQNVNRRHSCRDWAPPFCDRSV